MKHIFIFLVLTACFHFVYAENKYWISFKDKSGQTFDPYSYFSQRTIDQRIQNNIPLNDSTDYPVNPFYIETVSSLSDSVTWSSRWLNGIAIYASDNSIEKIKTLSFVRNVFEMNEQARIATSDAGDFNVMGYSEKLLALQTERMKGSEFKKNNLDGKGIRIAVFDVGFPGVDKNEVFANLRNNKQIVATYDFIHHKENVYSGHWHGTSTLSCIAGTIDTFKIGLATGAEFFLAKTERLLSEKFSEEENWLAAAEWADKQGVNIISSSLGYTFKRYFNTQMDGETSLVAKAAGMAAKKGILVVSAAGNEGRDSWHFIDTPGDADSVLTVGGTDPETDMHIYFSSYGPASDGKLKPNVSAFGTVIASKADGLAEISGTSFSTPLVAGFAACAWQSHRNWSNMELFNAIEKSAHLYPYFDYAHGFGIPQAEKILSENEPASPDPTFDFVIVNDDIKVVLREEFSYPSTEKSLGFNSRRNFYYKIEDKDGKIRKYFVLLAENKEMLHFFAEDFSPGDVLTIHFEGYTSSIDFPSVINEQK